jgi:peptidoglycan/LPS O-acetylase OafA/YrhL
LLAAVAVIAAGWAGDQATLHVVYFLALPYLLFFLAFVPGGAVRRFNAVGDYSYGLYLFAFPVQQVIVAFAPGVTVLELALGATAVSLAIAWCSWHMVEQPALAWKDDAARRLRELFARSRKAPPATVVGVEPGA